MRRWISLLTSLLLLLTPGLGEGIILHTVSSFAGSDSAAGAYVDILKAYEAESGNIVLDVSAVSDEAWKTGVLQDFAAGNEPDILFFFAAGADSAPILSRVVPVEEINEAYPELNLPENDALRESDGRVYAVPVRAFWEGLFVNVDVFEALDVPLPADWDSFCHAIRVFRENGVVPIAISLSDIPHYLVEFALLACASPEDLRARPRSLGQVPASWFEAMALIYELAEMGAFADNAFATNESASTALFRDKKAAMQIDGSWLVSSLPSESIASTMVLPVPVRSGTGWAENCIGGVSMGFYLTRRAWRSGRRDAAAALLGMLTREESIRRLGYSGLKGALIDSAEEMLHGRGLIGPLQDAMDQSAREVWLLECVPAVAEGRMTPSECWERVMALHPFGE